MDKENSDYQDQEIPEIRRSPKEVQERINFLKRTRGDYMNYADLDRSYWKKVQEVGMAIYALEWVLGRDFVFEVDGDLRPKLT